MRNFDDCNPPRPHLSDDGLINDGLKSRCDQSSPEALDNLKRDRFELLSAYLDGEVTADERRQVEHWLATEPKVQQLYSRLLKLRQNFRTLPVPPSEQPIEQLAARVISRLERRPKRTAIWGGAAIAALFMGAVMGTFSQSHLTPSVINAGSPAANPAATNDNLMIALDRPVIEIPKAASETGEQNSNSIQ